MLDQIWDKKTSEPTEAFYQVFVYLPVWFRFSDLDQEGQ